MQTATPTKNPLTWVPTGYFTMALTYNLFVQALVVLFSNLGLDNAQATNYAGWLSFAYTLPKPFLATFLEIYKSKKYFVLTSQLVQGGIYIAIAVAMHLPNYITLMIALFWILSFVGVTQDITTDGVYVTSLDSKTQSKYCGVQSLSWNLGSLFMKSVVIVSVGYLHEKVFHHDPHSVGAEWTDSWQIIFAVLGGYMFLAAALHWKFMPEGSRAEHAPANIKEGLKTLGEAFATFFQKKGIWLMIGFALLFRLSYGFLNPITQLFLKDTIANGGLFLTNREMGTIYGFFGTSAMLIGSLIGGFYVARKGLKTALFPLCLAVNIPNVTFLLLAIFVPHNQSALFNIDISWLNIHVPIQNNYVMISLAVIVEQLFFGIGSVGFMIYLMQQMAPGKFTTAHYAFGTGLMGLCMSLTSMVSGKLQLNIGYVWYFVFVMIATIPSFIICWLAPFHVKHGDEAVAKT